MPPLSASSSASAQSVPSLQASLLAPSQNDIAKTSLRDEARSGMMHSSWVPHVAYHSRNGILIVSSLHVQLKLLPMLSCVDGSACALQREGSFHYSQFPLGKGQPELAWLAINVDLLD